MKSPSRTCQSFTAATAKDGLNKLSGPRTRPGFIRTEILFDNDGVVEIYHFDGGGVGIGRDLGEGGFLCIFRIICGAAVDASGKWPYPIFAHGPGCGETFKFRLD